MNMQCERLGCDAVQGQLHPQPSTPSPHYCCKCNGCDSTCNAQGSNTWDVPVGETWYTHETNLDNYSLFLPPCHGGGKF